MTNRYNFVLFFKTEQIDFLKKYNFNEEIYVDSFTQEELWMIQDFKESGVLYSVVAQGKEYVQGTRIYKQILTSSHFQ